MRSSKQYDPEAKFLSIAIIHEGSEYFSMNNRYWGDDSNHPICSIVDEMNKYIEDRGQHFYYRNKCWVDVCHGQEVVVGTEYMCSFDEWTVEVRE